ncbi:MAG TPA: YafY family protein [Tepidisphaeraceae bacterium]|nr:YafY family protein [Tepidisphaeraceae bacterium]
MHESRDAKKLERLIRLITLIHGRRGQNADRLAEQFRVSKRTVYRDLRALERAGVPVLHNPETGGYEIGRDFFLPPVQLSLDEALAICALGEQIGTGQQVPFLQVASRAVEKIRGQLPGVIREQLADLQDHIAIQLARCADEDDAQDVFDKIRCAISNKRALRCVYESVTGRQNGQSRSGRPFLFKPYTLLFKERAWYVIGHHGAHDAVRCLRLGRFVQITPTDQPYAIPDTFSVGDHIGNAWRMIRGEKRYKVVIEFDREFADTVSETRWHATQKTQFHDNGSLTFRCTVDGLDEIVWWVLSMGPHAIVRAPQELADRVRELSARTASQYQTTA